MSNQSGIATTKYTSHTKDFVVCSPNFSYLIFLAGASAPPW